MPATFDNKMIDTVLILVIGTDKELNPLLLLLLFVAV
jgi:hypothetical protein